MIEVVGVRFKKAGKIYYFNPSNIEINKGEYVIVETIRGIEFGEAVIAKKQINENEIVAPLKNVIRKATEEDIKKHHENKEKEKYALETCLQKIQEHKLNMKLIDVEYTFDNNKVIFYFTADGRVDFRELVKDLASIFRTRIELRQIGVRDEAKMVGGLGPCGRPMCCSMFLGDFAPVSIKMAKEQNLSLNPTKISGICGRLMCCLNYEQQTYESIRKVLPKVGSIVKTPYGQGEVVDNNVVKEEIKVKIKGQDNEEFIQPVPIIETELISGGYEGNIESVNEEEINIEIDDADETIIKELLKDE
ncbi:stage 0 sporulation family protein [Clostridium sp. FAM 1755]|jgi:cell fate regulator YaaT (PSP1 superfamily)|uniref:Stage 0 sporulation protein n=2 Tax=Clostridium TaxID=1485 RepID=A0A6M0SYK8_CLOBO|nr:stage 0 sporulation family protein [Clostridium sporogenes]EJP6474017.1 stage 0 sporulation family protein [Clostridium botulinum]MDS1003241.1 stage 0 sporulation family protein [Clostridium sporogenes]NFA60587.1 stage 0 sporulation protein [Clostridium botulinum]NFI74243.1 stage 0 sporulation protein [Clostridium sporogenes]NFL73700.1 stage 0 sporulation protein [Clostridium sporogenes]